jgi:hypothetical protein
MLPPAYDLFVDLSGLELDSGAIVARVELLRIWCGFAQSAGQLTVALPEPVSAWVDPSGHVAGLAPTAAWVRAVAEATRRRQHLVVVLGGLLVGNEAIPPLLDLLRVDPLFGSVQPRFSDAASDAVWPLLAVDGPEAGMPPTSRAALPLLPETMLTAEMLAACLVIRREVVWTIEPATDFTSVVGAVAHSLCQARRRGFRNVVANRVVVASTLPAAAVYPALADADAARLQGYYPDAARAAAENQQQRERQLEPLLSAAYAGPGVQRRLLLDCRGLVAIHNGTSQCVLGMLDGYTTLDPPWRIEVLSTIAAAQYHALASRYPHFKVRDHVSGQYAAVLMMNQPWSVRIVDELHRAGFLIGFNILDTISWDIVYPAPARLAETWRFVARHSDIITYISRFSQDQFRRRFSVQPGVTEGVIHLSLATDEHALSQFRGSPPDNYVLLFGNDYDHKGIGPTIRLLVAAFPLQPFIVLGGCEPVGRNVRAMRSGAISGEDVHRLVSAARVVVFPSFYEGFGLPVVEGLAYGRPVLVRCSPLWTEIAAHSRFPGVLIQYDDPISLIEKLGQELSGLRPPGLPSGTALGATQAPTGWRDAAAAAMRLIEDRLEHGGVRHWLERDEALRLAAG